MNKDHLLAALSREGVLIDVSVRYWRASKKLKAEDLGLDPEDVSDRLISLGHKKLLPREALAPLALIESRAHAQMEAATFPFLGGIAHFLPNAKLATVTAKLDSLKADFAVEQARFIERYCELRADAARDWWQAARKLVSDPDRLVASIEASFPQAEHISRFFSFETQLFQVSVPEGISQCELVAAGDQAAIVEARDSAAREAAGKIRAGTEMFLAECVATLRQETATLCEEMLASMTGGKTGAVHQKTLNRLIRFIDEFKQLNFAGDAEMAEQLERVRKEFLSCTAEEYRGDKRAGERLTTGLARLRDTARELARQDSSDIVSRFGQMGVRKFNLAA